MRVALNFKPLKHNDIDSPPLRQGESKFKIHMIIYPKGYSKKTIDCFEFLIYKDSAPSDWLYKLEELKVQAFVSPLHDKDITEDGKPKKPHWHVIVFFSGGKSESLCQGIIDEVGGANGRGEVCKSKEASIRYLVHYGSKIKAHYDISEIIEIGGVSSKKYFSDTEADDTSLVTQCLDYIKKQRIWNFCDLVDYMITDKPSWLRAMRSTWFSQLVREYQRSLCSKQSNPEYQRVYT